MKTGWVACDYTQGDMLSDVRYSKIRSEFKDAENDYKEGNYEGVRYVSEDGYLYVDKPESNESMSKAKKVLEMLNEYKESGNWTIESALNSLKIAMIHSATKEPNPNAAAIGLKSFEGLEKKFAKKKSSSDPEDFKKLLRALPDYFTTRYSDYAMPEYPAKYTLTGLNKVVKAIAKHIGVEVDVKKKKSWED